MNSKRYMEFSVYLRALTHDLNRLYRYASAVWVLVDAGDIQEHIGWKMIGDMQVKLAIDDELVDHKLLGSINSPVGSVVNEEHVRDKMGKEMIRVHKKYLNRPSHQPITSPEKSRI